MEIWIPDSARDRQQSLLCRVCQTRFKGHQLSAYQRHVIACARQAEDDGRLNEYFPSRRDPALNGYWDPEKEPWLEKRFAEGRGENGQPLNPIWR